MAEDPLVKIQDANKLHPEAADGPGAWVRPAFHFMLNPFSFILVAVLVSD